MANPIFEINRYRRDLAEARALEEQLRLRFPEVDDARVIVSGAALDHTQIAMTGAPSTFWAAILDFAAKLLELENLLASVERNLRPAPRDQAMWTAIARVRQVTEAGGSLAPMRLLLKGNKPFLGRTTLRGIVPELRNWDSDASILVVRGDPDSGRTETQHLINEGRDPVREGFVLLHDQMSFETTLRAIWRAAGLQSEPPALARDTLTTESAKLMDFWTDVKSALDANDRQLWVLFDDLDKGAGRVAARTLAEVLAIQFRDVSFQQRIRLVMLGYPEPQLSSKVPAAIVRDDETDKIDDSHVRAFIDFCTNAAGKAVPDVAVAANDIIAKAKAKTNGEVPYLQALNTELKTWYRGL